MMMATAGILAAALLQVPSEPGAASAARHCLRRIEAAVESCRMLAPRAAALADRASAELAAGGHLYVAGDPGFVAEASGRAGGLMMTRSLGPPGLPDPHGVVVYGWLDRRQLDRDRDWLATLRQSGTLLIGIGPSSGATDEALPDRLSSPHSDAIEVAAERWSPVTPLTNAVLLWEWTGEIIASLSRRGLSPSVWESIWVPGAEAHNGPRQGHDYDPAQRLRPIPREKLARQYANALLRALRSLERASPEFARAGADLFAARRSGHAARVYVIAHMVGEEIGQRGDLSFFTPLLDPNPETRLGPGDALLGLAYVGVPAELEAAAARLGDRATWFAAPAPGLPGSLPAGQRWIDARWRLGDTAVSLPGYDVGALPPSGVLQLAAHWATEAALLAEGATTTQETPQ